MHDRSKIGSFSSGGKIEKLLKYCCSLVREFYEGVTQIKKSIYEVIAKQDG